MEGLACSGYGQAEGNCGFVDGLDYSDYGQAAGKFTDGAFA